MYLLEPCVCCVRFTSYLCEPCGCVVHAEDTCSSFGCVVSNSRCTCSNLVVWQLLSQTSWLDHDWDGFRKEVLAQSYNRATLTNFILAHADDLVRLKMDNLVRLAAKPNTDTWTCPQYAILGIRQVSTHQVPKKRSSRTWCVDTC